MVKTDKILEDMKNKGMTQFELARKMGMSSPTFSRKIRNERKFTAEEAIKLGIILNNMNISKYFCI